MEDREKRKSKKIHRASVSCGTTSRGLTCLYLESFKDRKEMEEEGYREMFEEIMAGNFPNLIKKYIYKPTDTRSLTNPNCNKHEENYTKALVKTRDKE